MMEDPISTFRRSRTSLLEAGEYSSMNQANATSWQPSPTRWTTAHEVDDQDLREIGVSAPNDPGQSQSGTPSQVIEVGVARKALSSQVYSSRGG
jgi:hypothetical protein